MTKLTESPFPAVTTTATTAPFLELTWHDTQSPATGYVVVDQLVAGICTGGTRMRPDCTPDEVADLAREMTLKMATYGIHVGGAKGGIDFDPTDPRAPEVRRRFVQAFRPILEYYWVTAGDLGTPQHLLDRAFSEAGLGASSFHAALVRAPEPATVMRRVGHAFTERVDGLTLSELVGGFGVAEAALAGLYELHTPATSASAVVQGFGAMGGSTALYLARAGVKVVGISDALGAVCNSRRGLDVPTLLASRREDGTIDRAALRSDDEVRPREEWLSLEADVLVPAAVSYVITGQNCDAIRARLVVEAANVATSEEAERRLVARGVQVIPDFVANTGAAAAAWWVILGEVDGPTSACTRLSAEIRPLVSGLMTAALQSGESIRGIGTRLAKENLSRMIDEYGDVVPTKELFSPTRSALQSGSAPPAPPPQGRPSAR